MYHPRFAGSRSCVVPNVERRSHPASEPNAIRPRDGDRSHDDDATLCAAERLISEAGPAEPAAVRGQVVQATVDVASAEAEVQALDTQVARLDLQLVDLTAGEARKADELDARKALLADRLRQAYAPDRPSLLETFLSGDTFTDVLAEVSYHLDFAQQDRELAEQIVAAPKGLTVLLSTVAAIP